MLFLLPLRAQEGSTSVGREESPLIRLGNKKALKIEGLKCLSDGDPGEARTLDPLIKSQLLYQLSYGVMHLYLVTSFGNRLSRFSIVTDAGFKPATF